MIIGLSGYARSGKDTVAEFLIEEYDFKRVAFADTIRDILYAMNPSIGSQGLKEMVDNYGWDVAKANGEVRALLQTLGVSARTFMGDGVWISAAVRKMLDAETNYVIPDVRFTNEADMIKRIGGHVWRVNRPGVGPINDHVSENQLDNYKFNGEINNSGSLDGLYIQIATLQRAAKESDLWSRV